MTFKEAKEIKTGTVVLYKGDKRYIKILGKELKSPKDIWFTCQYTGEDEGIIVVHHRTLALPKR